MNLALPILLAVLSQEPASAGAPPVDWTRIPAAVGAEALTAQQKATLAKVLQEEFCYCGCPHTLAGCLTEHTACKHAPRMAALAARLAGQGLGAPEIHRLLTDYYASFDRAKRTRLDVADFGPALGDANAPVTIVEFSDFVCPFCAQLRPKLEDFVEKHPGKVKLIYKPFPLAMHARAEEAAEAAEWARDAGVLWSFYDALFENNKALDDASLGGLAERFGKDPADLKKALETQKYRSRVLEAQAEARRGGLLGTPTLFFNGRRHILPDFSDTILEFVLEDEEEWLKSSGWRD
ncbi:MAG TPA: thioredoxin domain-containing protein [Anaeromyxobacteraceae bacterium]|nr:thioredoxin domain-containing protein [Anaeromyxobacteraceae bacterium]